MNNSPSFGFSTAQIDYLCRDLQKRLDNAQVAECLSIAQDRFIILFRQTTEVNALFFCFTPPFTRFHLIEVESLKDKQPKTSPLDAFLKKTILKSIETINQDRIVRFHFDSPFESYFLYCEFFSKYPNYYLTTITDRILISMHPTKKAEYFLPLKTQFKSDNPPPVLSHVELDAAYIKLEQAWRISKEKSELQRRLTRSLKNFKSKKQALEAQLEQCKNREAVQHQGDLIKAHLGLYKKGVNTLQVWDWLNEKQEVLLLDPRLTIHEEMALRYKRAKKLHRGIEPVQNQLRIITDKVSDLELQIRNLENLTSEKEIAAMKAQLFPSITKIELEERVIKKTLPYHEFFSEKKIPILVGKNARSNEILTFRIAKGNDWWLHVNGMAGSHIIIKMPKSEKPDEDTLQDAVQLALFHSKARDSGGGEVYLTQKKYVSRLGKDKVGKVQISKHSTIYADLDKERYKKIRERSRML